MSLLQIRLSEEEKFAAKDVASRMGMTLSGAVKLFLRQMVTQQKLPFDVIAAAPTPKQKTEKKPKEASKKEKSETISQTNTQQWKPFQKRQIGSED